MSIPTLPPSLQALAPLFVKSGVGIGGLSDAQRQRVLGMVWAGLPAAPMTEREVNEALKARLAGAARFLDTDHVELRRWLVDAGWLARDGFGRQYQRVAGEALPAASRPLAASFDGVDADAVAAAARAAEASSREARQRAWQARNHTPG